MHSSAFGAADLMAFRGFSSAARFSLLKGERYSSMVCGLACGVGLNEFVRRGFVEMHCADCALRYCSKNTYMSRPKSMTRYAGKRTYVKVVWRQAVYIAPANSRKPLLILDSL